MKLLAAIAAISVIGCAAIVTLLALGAPPTTRELDDDLARVRQQIVQGEAEMARYGGAILTLIEARVEALRTSEAFLQMKRDALLRRVDLQFNIDGTPVAAADPARLASIERDIEATTAKLERSKLDAERSGGLVGTMAAVEVATHELALAQLNLSLVAERHGMLLRMPSASAAPAEPVGKTIVSEDGEAL